MTKFAKKIILARKISKLGQGFRDRFRLASLVFWPFVQKKLRMLGIVVAPSFRVHVLIKGKEFFLHLEGLHDEITLLSEIFIEECYRTDEIKNPSLIIDAGANIGFASIYFAAKYPSATIYAVEPDPSNFERLKRNVGDIDRIRPCPVAFSGTNGEMDLYLSEDKIISSSAFRRKAGQKSVKVKSAKLDTFAQEKSISHCDIFKFDVEGGEYDMFYGCRLLEATEVLIGEVHEDLMGKSAEEFYKILPEEFHVLRREVQKEHREFFYARQEVAKTHD